MAPLSRAGLVLLHRTEGKIDPFVGRLWRSRPLLPGCVSGTLLVLGTLSNPWLLGAMGLVLFSRPVPVSGFWITSLLALSSGSLLLLARHYAWASRWLLAVVATSGCLIAVDSYLRLQPPLEVTGASQAIPSALNQLGWPDSEPRFDARRRILVLGDSITWGMGDELDGTTRYHDLLGIELGARGWDVDVQAAAQPGWQLKDYVREAAIALPYYQPDVVVVALCMNDLLYGDGDNGTLQQEGESWRRQLRPLYQQLRPNEWYLWTVALRRGQVLLRRAGWLQADWIDHHENTYQRQVQAAWQSRPLLDQVDRDLTRLQEQCTRFKARLLVVVFPFRFHVVTGQDQEIVVVRNILAARRLDYLDLFPIFARTNEELFSFRDECHPNRRGHELAAAALLELLLQDETE